MNPSPSRYARGILALTLLLPTEVGLRSEPFLPTDGQAVLERLRSTPFDPATRDLRALRARLAADPDNLSLAAQFARRCIEQSHVEGDLRYLGYARGALARWWDESRPPREALVLRATIKQSQHDFTNALADLDLALKYAPTDAQAWLTKVTVLTVLGRYDEARQSCIPLIQLAPGLIGVAAAANIASLNGEAERSCQLLRRALDGSPAAGTSEKLWTLTILAESSGRLGRRTDAEDYFRSALALGQHDVYLLGAYADFLLDEGRAREVEKLLGGENRSDALLLRLVLAESVLDPRPSSFESHLAALCDRFEASRLRGDKVHQREESRFTLHLLGQPRQALLLAQDNWRVQREPADVRILLESAVAANDPKAAEPAIEFIHHNRLEDVHLMQLREQLAGLVAK